METQIRILHLQMLSHKVNSYCQHLFVACEPVNKQMVADQLVNTCHALPMCLFLSCYIEKVPLGSLRHVLGQDFGTSRYKGIKDVVQTKDNYCCKYGEVLEEHQENDLRVVGNLPVLHQALVVSLEQLVKCCLLLLVFD